MTWIIKYYATNNDNPIEAFIESLDSLTISKIIRLIQGLKILGPNLRMPLARQLSGGLYELRIRGKQEVRLIYCYYQHQIILLHEFIKKTNKTPSRHLKLASVRYQELLHS